MPAQSSRKRSSPNSTDAQPILQMACLLQCYSVFQVAQYSNCIGTSSGEGSDFSLSTNKLVLPILYNQEGRRRTVSGDRFLDRSGAHLIVNTLQNSHNFKPIDVKWGTLTCPWWEYLFHKNRQKLQTTSPHPHPCYQTEPGGNAHIDMLLLLFTDWTSRSVVSGFLRPHGLQPAMLLCPWVSQARILEWAVISFSRRSSQPRDWTRISCIGMRFLYHYTTGEAHI